MKAVKRVKKLTKKRKLRKRLRPSRRQKGGGNKVVVFTLTNNAGFGSVFGFLLMTYIYAQTKHYDFRIKNENWLYSPNKGWHEFFTTLKDYNPSEKYDSEENYRHATNGTSSSFTLEQYNKAIQEVYVPTNEILTKANEFIDTIGGPYVSFFIRRGDKVSGASKEMDAINIKDIVSLSGVKEGNVFVMSDEYSAVKEIIDLLPNCKIHTLTPSSSSGFSVQHVQKNGGVPRNEAIELFTSIEVFHRGEKGWADNRSNIGRLLKMRDLDKVILYPASDKTQHIPLSTVVSPSTRELSSS